MEVSVNLKNPSQFFAAAGLAVLLNMPSRFEVTEYEGQPKFRASFVLPNFDIGILLGQLKSATYVEISEAGGAKYSAKEESKVENLPVRMQVGEQTFELDWWLNEFWSDKSGLKLWAGTTVPISLLRRLRELLPATSKDILNETVETSKSNRPSWGFRPVRQTGVAANLDRVKIYPIAELLCAVGLQYFRPVMSNDGITFFVWRDELPWEAAMAAGELEGVRTYALTSRREKCGQGKFSFTAAEFVIVAMAH
jgi:CRISPR-associated protein Csb3